MTAATAGQAAYEAFKAWRAERDPIMIVADWTHPMVEAAREGWEAAARAARDHRGELAPDYLPPEDAYSPEDWRAVVRALTKRGAR